MEGREFGTYRVQLVGRGIFGSVLQVTQRCEKLGLARITQAECRRQIMDRGAQGLGTHKTVGHNRLAA